MVTVNQNNANIQQQIITEFADFRGSVNASLFGGEHPPAKNELQAAVAATDKAVALGLMDEKTGQEITGDLAAAISSLDQGDKKAASQQVEKATRRLQLAAPLVAIGASLISAWNGMSGTP